MRMVRRKIERIALALLVVLSCLQPIESLYRSRTVQRYDCSTPIIKNGFVRLKQRGRLVRYQCEPTYILHGDRYSSCQSGRWENPIPICIKAGCPKQPPVDHGMIALLNSDASALLFCLSGYQVAGSNVAFCDGIQWDRSIGSCREIGGTSDVWCDFETNSLCGWANDPNNDFEWKRRSGYSASTHIRTGPRHDHTIKIPLEGHYMVAELTSVLHNDAARIISPVYPANLSKDACFRFFYHMFGLSVGTLSVYIKPVSQELDTILENQSFMLFQKRGSQGNLWMEAIFTIDEMQDNFQIVIEASATKSRLSDIAIDDVALLNGGDCIEETSEIVTDRNDEDGGIYDIQSCVNRCNETTSITATTDETITLAPQKARAIIERCDCHPECENMKSCCLDYRSVCVFDNEDTSQSTTEQTESQAQTQISTILPKSTSSTTIATTKAITAKITQPPTTKMTTRKATTTTKATTITKATTTTQPTTTTIKYWKIVTKTKPTTYSTTTVASTTKQITTKTMPQKAMTIVVPVTAKSSSRASANQKISNRPITNITRVIVLSIIISAVILVVTMALWRLCIPNVWKRIRRNPLDYKTKYYSKKNGTLNEMNDDAYDENEPINGSRLNDVHAKITPTTANQEPSSKRTEKSHSSDYSKQSLLANDDEEQIDFTLREC